MMAGIYISGMEMPKSCSTEACFVRTVSYEDGTVWCPVAKGYLGDQATVCPLIPVTDHGRLIDADKALRDGWTISRTYQASPTEMVYEVRAIDFLPTVIPADGKDTNVPTKTAEEVDE